MTRRPIQCPAGWWLVPAVILGGAMWVGFVALAFAQGVFAWNADTRVVMQPTSQPGAKAEVVFTNTAIHLEPIYSFPLTLDGLTVDVLIEINAEGVADRMTVTPPEGYIAWPESVVVPEDGAGRVLIMNEGMM